MPPNPESSPLLMVDEDHSEVPLTALEQARGSSKAPSQPPPQPPPLHIKWFNVSFLAAMHLGLLYSLTWAPSFKWQTWIWVLLTIHLAGFGVTGGAHRLWTHRSYKATLPLRVLMMLFYSVAGMNSIFDWVRDHRVHHKFSETDADPHNAKRGFFFAHVGWLMVRKHPEVVRRGQSVDLSDVLADPVVTFERRHHVTLFYLLCFIIPTVVPVLWWDETWICSFSATMVRWVFSVNFVWSVNSVAHLFGGHPFNKFINPADNLAVAIVAMGEGWHNYHHVFPWDYRVSEHGFLNTTMHLIGLFRRLGWAYDLKTAPPTLVRRVASRYGDGSHPDWAAHAPEVPEAAVRDPAVLDDLPPPPRHDKVA